MTTLARNNVNVTGSDSKPMIFVHGFGCDQNMWRHVAPAFAVDYKVVLYDLTGAGKSDLSAYDLAKYSTLQGHATDLLEICDTLNFTEAVIVGHSVGAMIAVLAANRDRARLQTLILVGPSPYYINENDYAGGFSRKDIDELLEFLDTNHLGWSAAMAPAFMGVPDRPELGEELSNSFCRTDPAIAAHFARVTFKSDHRADVKRLKQRALIMQCSNDIVAPFAVGQWLHENLSNSTLVVMRAMGHCPHMSEPAETVHAIRSFLK